MGQTVRTTVYLDRALHRALRVKAAESSETLSSLVSNAVLESLREDDADLKAFEKRRRETSRPLRDVIRDLKRDGRL